jgi:hypothetical protein
VGSDGASPGEEHPWRTRPLGGEGGWPLALAPDHDDPSTRVPKRINKFDFGGDPEGENTPIFAHIRKTYPRGGRFDDNLHRIMRRGYPVRTAFRPRPGQGARPGCGPPKGRQLLRGSPRTQLQQPLASTRGMWLTTLQHRTHRQFIRNSSPCALIEAVTRTELGRVIGWCRLFSRHAHDR